MEISEILERAKAKLNITSDRKLAGALGVDPKLIGQYRRLEKLPSDNTMMNICLASGIEPELGLLRLNIVRTDGRASAIYRRMLKTYEQRKVGTDARKTA